jgi:hypothetical protein
MPDPPGTQWLKTARQAPPSFVQGAPQGLLKPGILDLNARPVVANPAAGPQGYSTVRSISVTDDQGRAYLLPTVIDGKLVSNEEAIAHWKQTGEHLGYFDTEDNANAYAKALHEAQAQQYAPTQHP